MKTQFIKLLLYAITILGLASCSLFGIEKVSVRKSDFTHTEDDVLCKAKLYFIYDKQEKITYPIETLVPYSDRNGRSWEKPTIQYFTEKYQPSITFITKNRFVAKMRCTIYGKISKVDNNTFTIDYFEESIDCVKNESNLTSNIETFTLKNCNKCRIENGIIYFYKDDSLLMVYNVE